MSKAKLHIGLRWGHMKAVSSGKEDRITAQGPGWKETDKIQYFECRCDCGRTKRIWANEWKGVKKQKDCGCGIAELDGNIIHVNATITSKHKIALGRYSKENNVTFSETLRQAIDTWLSVIEVGNGTD